MPNIDTLFHSNVFLELATGVQKDVASLSAFPLTISHCCRTGQSGLHTDTLTKLKLLLLTHWGQVRSTGAPGWAYRCGAAAFPLITAWLKCARAPPQVSHKVPTEQSTEAHILIHAPRPGPPVNAFLHPTLDCPLTSLR